MMKKTGLFQTLIPPPLRIEFHAAALQVPSKKASAAAGFCLLLGLYETNNNATVIPSPGCNYTLSSGVSLLTPPQHNFQKISTNFSTS